MDCGVPVYVVESTFDLKVVVAIEFVALVSAVELGKVVVVEGKEPLVEIIAVLMAIQPSRGTEKMTSSIAGSGALNRCSVGLSHDSL